MKTIRCAIYTRKSSEEGLEQDFNSLDAQHAACAAYITSQASEGWSRVGSRYEDGGISGGTLQRPGLMRLLDDIRSGLIDIVVVYKVDRLTRSLLDFSKLVETFDQAGVSFVSVTQSFNTTNSMGRLTLNMLLSFAQFEREVTAERIRDKIAASKQRGMWMGGTPPIGYRPDGRSLAIVEDEAALVRRVYALYLELGIVSDLQAHLLRERIEQPVRISLTGRTYGGGPFNRAQLYRMLNNPLYIGLICHGAQRYPGNHPPIIDMALWENVQAQLSGNTQGKQQAPTVCDPGLLVGKLFDADETPLVSNHSAKGKVRYRYYVSRHLQHGCTGTDRAKNDGANGVRIPALEIEPLIIAAITKQLGDMIGLATALGYDLGGPDAAWQLTQRAEQLANILATSRPAAQQSLLSTIVRRIDVHPEAVQLTVATDALRAALKLSDVPAVDPASTPATDIGITLPVRLKRSGMAMRLVLEAGGSAIPRSPDAQLLAAISKGRAWWRQLQANPDMTVAALARAEKVGPTYVDRILRLAFLSPKIIEAIISGTAPANLTLERLKDVKLIDLDWAEQHRLLGTA
ncbi:recombinase family protein [Sandarakinorhabdus sp.]|uniref:recombinase family protein n=1 Tax=Sandarakinorhabdus sp. TaxID=1916663 RepID=UPI0033424CE2